MTTEFRHPQRYYLRKWQSREFDSRVELGIGAAYLAKHDELGGMPLPAEVPYQDLLAEAHYTSCEDFDGTDAAELITYAGLTAKQAAAVIRATTPFPEGQLMITRSPLGHPLSLATNLLTVALLKALDVVEHVPGEFFFLTDGRVFKYMPASVLAGDDLFVVAPTAGTGRYVLAQGLESDVAFTIDFSTADAAILGTLPAGMICQVLRGYWEVTTDFTGGTSSAIGVSSSNATGQTTKGDLHGGASGDVLATLVAGTKLGTIGAKIAAGSLLVGANTVRFDRVTSAFTAGAGKAHLILRVLANPG